MRQSCKTWLLIGTLAGVFTLGGTNASEAQYQRRFQPSRPTISPYLDLFRFNDSNVPNYYTFVRPQQQQRAFEQQQQQLNRQQSQVLNQLQSNVQTLKLGPVTAPQVAPTGHGSWFNRPGSSTFLNTSGFYSQSPGGSQSSGGRR